MPIPEPLKTVLRRVRHRSSDHRKSSKYEEINLKSLTDGIEYSVSPKNKHLRLEASVKDLAKRLEIASYNIRETVSELPVQDTLRVLLNLELKSIKEKKFRDYNLYSTAALFIAVYGDWSRKDESVAGEPLVEYLSQIDHFILNKNTYNIAAQRLAEKYSKARKTGFGVTATGIKLS